MALLASCASSATLTPSPSAPTSATPTERLGPGGLTLDEEVGAVIMAGFQGPVTDTVIADWKQHQFGGLLVVNLNHNGTTAASMSNLISSVRAATRHRLIAATDQEGGGVCIAISSVPCEPMPTGAPAPPTP